MRITFVASRCWPSHGGQQTYLRLLALGLRQQGHHVKIIGERIDDGPNRPELDALMRKDRWEPFSMEGIPVIPLRVPLARRIGLSPIMIRRVPRFEPRQSARSALLSSRVYSRVVGPEIADSATGSDVLHMWGGSMLAAATVRAAERLRIPAVITPQAHEGQWDDDAGSADAYQHANMVIASTDTDADLYRRLGVNPERIMISEPCSEIPSEGGVLGAELAAVGDRPLVLFLGVRRPYKGVDLLTQAARVLHGVRPDVAFAFVGPGPALEVRREERSYLLDIGPVSDEDRLLWLRRANLVCLPSSNESFGLVVAEAWSVGTPALVSDIPVLRELVSSAGGGITVDRSPEAMAQALATMLSDSKRLAELGQRGKRYWVERLTVEAAVERHSRLYAQLASSRSRRPTR